VPGGGDGAGKRQWWQPGWRKVTRTSRSLKLVVDGGWSPRTSPPLPRCGLGVYALKAAVGTQPFERWRTSRISGEGKWGVRTMVVSRAKLEPMYIIRVSFSLFQCFFGKIARVLFAFTRGKKKDLLKQQKLIQ